MVQRLAIFFLMLCIMQTASGMRHANFIRPLRRHERCNPEPLLREQAVVSWLMVCDRETGYEYALSKPMKCLGCNKKSLVVPCSKCTQKQADIFKEVFGKDDVMVKLLMNALHGKDHKAADILHENAAQELIRVVECTHPMLKLNTISIIFHTRARVLALYQQQIEQKKNLEEGDKVRQEMEMLMNEPIAQVQKKDCCCVVQ